MFSNIDRKTFNNEAMRGGTFLGLLWIAMYAAAVGGMSNPSYLPFFMILFIASPFYAAYLAKCFRKKYCNNVMRFTQAWLFILMEYICASLLSAIAIYIYLKFFDSTVITDTMSKMVQIIEQQPQIYGDSATQFKEAFEFYSNLSIRDIVLNITTSNLMNGTIIAPVIALFIKRNQQ